MIEKLKPIYSEVKSAVSNTFTGYCLSDNTCNYSSLALCNVQRSELCIRCAHVPL